MEPTTSSDGLWLGSDHIGYATRNTDATVRFLEAMGYSLKIYKRELEKFGVYITKLTSPDSVVVEVVEPSANESVISQLLAGREAAVYHACFRTTDFNRAVEKAKAEGAITVTNPMTIPFPVDEEHSHYLATHMYHPHLGLFEITGPPSMDRGE